MACYVCAYGRASGPQTVDPLPASSAVAVTEPIGTCWRCSVWACSIHATRPGQFECVICVPASATQNVVTPSGAPSTASGRASSAASALLVGQAATPEQLDRTAFALARIQADHEAAPERPELFAFARATAEPNLIANLAGSIQEQRRDDSPVVPEIRDDFADARGDAVGALPLETIAAAVRGKFLGAQVDFAPTSEERVRTVTGALLLASTVAHRQPSDARSIDPSAVELPPPWEMTHPVLLDPVMWLVATAYHSR